MPRPVPATHRVDIDAAGVLLLVKRVSDAAGRARLAAEATTLTAIAHPGMVRVRSHTDDGTVAELALEWVGSHSLATISGLAPGAAATLVADVADTVADLHTLGIAHRRLTPDHVLLGPGTRPVLTGCADATGGDRQAITDDVAALGDLLTDLVAPADDGPVVPDRRPRRRGDAGLRGALLTLADVARADDPESRPSAAGLASLLRTTAPTGRRHRRRRRAARVHVVPVTAPAAPTRPPDAAPAVPTRPPAPAMGADRPTTGPSRPSPPPGLRPPATNPPSTPPGPGAAPVITGHRKRADEAEHDPTSSEGAPPAVGPRSTGTIGRPPPGRRRRRTATVAPKRGTVAAMAEPEPNPGPNPGPAPEAESESESESEAMEGAPPAVGLRSAGTIGRPPAGRRHRRRRTANVAPKRGTVAAVALAAAVAATGAAVTWVLPDDDPAPSTAHAAPTTTAPRAVVPTTTAAPPTSAPEVGAPELLPSPSPSPAPTVPPAPADGGRCAPVAGPEAADVDGDGCPDPVLIDDERITVGDTTWVVGRPGDTLAVGDWDCDGTATAAVLRPSTGEVFVFDRWIAPGDELTVAATATVEDGTAIETDDADGDGCAELSVTRGAGGPAVPVAVGELR